MKPKPMGCLHPSKRLLKVDKWGIFLEWTYWCRHCGAIQTAKGWTYPKHNKNDLLVKCNRMENALKTFAICSLSDETCANLDVANRRIRNLARSALEGGES